MIPGKILVTGGCGYIGGHTIVDLVNNGFDVISVDDLSRGSLRMLEGVEAILGRTIKNYKVDLTNLDDTQAVFIENPDIVGIIHFAAYKSVNESVEQPLNYYRNNINSLVNILQCAKDYQVSNVVFSSSCSVYGNADRLPVDEQTPLATAESPYAFTKQIGEVICRDFARQHAGFNIILLRYFNPVGAHPSVQIGELQEKPENLVPVITQTAIGKRESMTVFGDDYDTRDGSCIRDYIHVMDIAQAHTRSLEYLLAGKSREACTVFNLGSGNGVTVLELIKAFEAVSGRKLNHMLGPRRAGDVIAVYADNTKARKLLGWEPRYSLDKMMDTAWRWEQKLQVDEQMRMN
ncbi:MAG: UDP-glucose 4-epimerase GalE [Chitinophagaceae bacterium]|nr:UDP-glucose 4-epimerase GalE [Chitinophagaceae bacterium]